jgi:cellulose 1,4-beta-cellobiosidase
VLDKSSTGERPQFLISLLLYFPSFRVSLSLVFDMFPAAALLSFTLLAVTSAQQIGTNTAEVHPSLTVSQCTTNGGCTSSTQSIVLDANWRWLHSTSGYTNCYTGNQWNSDLCPDPDTCASNCALDGASYESEPIITTYAYHGLP